MGKTVKNSQKIIRTQKNKININDDNKNDIANVK